MFKWLKCKFCMKFNHVAGPCWKCGKVGSLDWD